MAEGKTPVNLQSVMIGNGITDFYSTTDSYFPFVLHASSHSSTVTDDQQQCTLQRGLNSTVQDIGTCVEMAEAVRGVFTSLPRLNADHHSSRNATSSHAKAASNHTTIPNAPWRSTTVSRCSVGLSSGLESTRQSSPSYLHISLLLQLNNPHMCVGTT